MEKKYQVDRKKKQQQKKKTEMWTVKYCQKLLLPQQAEMLLRFYLPLERADRQAVRPACCIHSHQHKTKPKSLKTNTNL